LINHPHAITCWPTVRNRRDLPLETVLVVETDLVILRDEAGYDGDAFSSLGRAIDVFMRENPRFDMVEVHHVNGNAHT
jgi:hypothetical protein